jgi:hypothetical protein
MYDIEAARKAAELVDDWSSLLLSHPRVLSKT